MGEIGGRERGGRGRWEREVGEGGGRGRWARDGGQWSGKSDSTKLKLQPFYDLIYRHIHVHVYMYNHRAKRTIVD